RLPKTSCSFSTAMICSSVKRLFLMAVLLVQELLLDGLRLRQEFPICHQDADVPSRSHRGGHRGIVPPQDLFHSGTGGDERLRHLLGLQVAVAEGEAGYVTSENRRQFERVAAHCLVLGENDPPAAAGFGEPFRVRAIVCE